MIKYLILLCMVALTTAATCSVKEEIKGLQSLKVECENTQLELESIGAKKWPKTIADKVKQCKDHGFGEWDTRKKKNSFSEIEEDKKW